jgi:hypothetical protein
LVVSSESTDSAGDVARPKRVRRRVTTPPPSGSDPTPVREEPRHTLEENDDRLKAEKPPHY